ncbi:type II toxin-antitoxin system RelE family toxin [Aeromonas dhakensis]|uniref:type II toxin-antitoxin system RelE family toxin n=1 Tax=Aeromonas dhakensis TaxID=196024 RepID=UPI0005A8982C|nr:type II toxin-antitoxin system RelE/ParE family toxin [Aeromonas dhakensis]
MYELDFDEAAWEEWQRLDHAVRSQAAKKLAKVLEHPHNPANALHGDLAGCYKVKLLKAGVRIVYTVEDDRLVVLVLAVGKRDKSAAYRAAEQRR